MARLYWDGASSMAPSARELSALVGRTGLVEFTAGIKVPVRVLNSKYSYGVVRVLVEPVHGFGQAWIGFERIELDETQGGRP